MANEPETLEVDADSIRRARTLLVYYALQQSLGSDNVERVDGDQWGIRVHPTVETRFVVEVRASEEDATP